MDDYIQLVKCVVIASERYMNDKSMEYLFCFSRHIVFNLAKFISQILMLHSNILYFCSIQSTIFTRGTKNEYLK
jgi:hypothetical protein